LTLFAVSKDEWDTIAESREESIVCTYCGMPKGTSWAEAMLNNEKIKPVSTALVNVSSNQSLKFYSSLIKAFQVNHKA